MLVVGANICDETTSIYKHGHVQGDVRAVECCKQNKEKGNGEEESGS